jgi:hypothetical protein
MLEMLEFLINSPAEMIALNGALYKNGDIQNPIPLKPNAETQRLRENSNGILE